MPPKQTQGEAGLIDRTMIHAPQREKIQTRIKRMVADQQQDLDDLKTLLKYLPDDMNAKDESRINRILGNINRPRY